MVTYRIVEKDEKKEDAPLNTELKMNGREPVLYVNGESVAWLNGEGQLELMNGLQNANLPGIQIDAGGFIKVKR